MTITFSTPTAPSAIVTTAVAGTIDLATIPQLHQHIGALLATDAVTGVILDLSAVTFLDSSGIGALIGCLNRANRLAKSLRIVNARGLVQEVLELTNVMPLLSGETTTTTDQ